MKLFEKVEPTPPKKEEKAPFGCMVMLAVAVIAFIVGIWIFASYMEARSYNRVTGENVSTWDAMWIELRVQSEPKSR